MQSSKTLLLVLSLSLALVSFGQQSLKGKIVEAGTQKPIAGASVFISNTSIGTVSNSKGEFEITQLPSKEFELVVSFIGYEPYVQHIAGPQQTPLLIALQQKANELQDVVVSTYEKDGWKKWGDFFLSAFIGTSAYAKDCVIKNYKTIRFKYSKKNNFISAHASEPLIIENKALGYHLKYELIHFSYDFNSKYLMYAGYPFFTEMQGNKRRIRKWKENREEAYTGSMMHFMRAMYRNTVDKAGFEMRRLEKKPNLEKQRVKALYQYYTKFSVDSKGNNLSVSTIDVQVPKDSMTYYEKVLREKDVIEILHTELVHADSIAYGEDSVTAVMDFKDYLLITYPAKQEQPEYYQDRLLEQRDPYITSAICLINNIPVKIQSNGSYNNPVDLISTGYWSWSEKIATMLPFDYKPSTSNRE